MRPLRMAAQTAWQDLRRLLQDTQVSDLRGTPKRKAVNGKHYWYDQFRLGTNVVEKYIGEDTPALRTRMERLQDIQTQGTARNKETQRLVRLLRAENLLVPDLTTGQILTALAKSGAFRLGGTLIGTQAFRCYEGLLGVHLSTDDAAFTDDIDIASFERLSLALHDAGDTADLAPVFRDFKFAPVPSLEPRHVWKWRQTQRNTLIEFLTPSFEADEALKDLPALGVSAQSLHFLNYLIADPVQVPLLYRAGALIQVPQPARYAIHKLIVADRRRDGDDAPKARKDRAQADFLIRHFAEEDPDAIADAFTDAMSRGPKWRERLERTLARLPDAKRVLDAATG